jgi:tetratricopeptide (TPR) repeat protein
VEGTAVYRELAAMQRKINGETHRDVERALANLARSLEAQGELSEAEAVWREELAVERRISGDEHPSVANSLWELARMLMKAGRLDEAEQPFREAWEIRRKSLGNDDRLTIETGVFLGLIQRSQDKKGEAVAFLSEELDHAHAADGKGGDTNSWLGVVLHHFAEDLCYQKKFNKARQPAEEAWALYQQRPGWPENERGHAYRVLAGVLTGLNDQAALDALDSLQRDELARLRGKLSAGDPKLANFLANSAWSLLTRKKFAEAEAPARESLAIREKAIPDDWLTFNSRSMLGEILLGQKKYAEAESFLLSGYQGMKQREKSIPAAGKIPEAIQRLAELYEATGQPEKAAEWKKKLGSDRAKAEK